LSEVERTMRFQEIRTRLLRHFDPTLGEANHESHFTPTQSIESGSGVSDSPFKALSKKLMVWVKGQARPFPNSDGIAALGGRSQHIASEQIQNPLHFTEELACCW